MYAVLLTQLFYNVLASMMYDVTGLSYGGVCHESAVCVFLDSLENAWKLTLLFDVVIKF